MKKKLISSLVFSSLILFGCGSIDDKEDFVDKFKEEGLTLSETKLNTYFKLGLDGISEYSFKTKNNDEYLIYEINKKVNMEELLKQFDDQYKLANKKQEYKIFKNKELLVIFIPMSQNDNIDTKIEKILSDFEK